MSGGWRNPLNEVKLRITRALFVEQPPISPDTGEKQKSRSH